MIKKVLIIILVLVISGALFASISSNRNQPQEPESEVSGPIPTTIVENSGVDPLNTTYVINEEPVTLVNGKAQKEAAPGSSSVYSYSAFGTPTKGELNGDILPDSAFLLVEDTAGSGTFYYIVASIQNPNGTYTGTNGIFLGDRIAPQTTQITNEQIIVNYAEKKPDEPMTAQPSVAVSKWFEVDGTVLMEVPQPTT